LTVAQDARRLVARVAFLVACIGGLATAPTDAAAISADSRSDLCDHSHPLTVEQQDRLLRFSAAIRTQLDAGDPHGAALISRSGLDLSRFEIRYSHEAIATRNDAGGWTARQLYYACAESRPRLYDQGLAGFTMGTDDPAVGYVSIVQLPTQSGASLAAMALDTPRVLELLAARYSADAYPFSTRYQNCNQWVMEVIALAWGNLADDSDLRRSAQQWLRDAQYSPRPVSLGSPLVVLALLFVPLLHLDDQPINDVLSLQLKISLPSTIETFVRDRVAAATRTEVCYNDQAIVIHHGWDPVADGCRPAGDDQVLPFEADRPAAPAESIRSDVFRDQDSFTMH
jgi:hypothetical protein